MSASENFSSQLKRYRLTKDEVKLICEKMNRKYSDSGVDLNPVEWAVFSALWSEHCSYKSSKVHLKKFAQTLDSKVLGGSGENAGMVDLGEGERIIFKMESHNHPSFIEPYQGAATGVGGILRDIFTMGARPIACADYLCFGDEGAPRMAQIIDGVVRGIGGYGNPVGVPTVSGQTNFHPSYNTNVLVNAMALGLLRPNEKIALSQAKGPGNLVVYVGAKTGKDGVHGAAMASESFDEDSSSKKPNVQIGDPYFEKLLIESCLEVLQNDLVVAIQDMGAAGLTSSSFEMASKGQVGMRLQLDQVPLRDSTMAADEILLSESQERMLLVCEPEKLQALQDFFEKWGLDAVPVGEILQERRMQIYMKQELLFDLDPDILVEQAPQYSRAYSKWQSASKVENLNPSLQHKNLQEYLLQQLKSVKHASRKPIYHQFDQRVGLLTLHGADHDVAVLRLPDSKRGLALVVGCRPDLMHLDARVGAMDAALYPHLQMSIKGFQSLAMTDCLNFGNPEKEKIMTEFVASVDALIEVSLAIKAPVISGNVSFYNETLGKNIVSTPAIGMVGIRDSIENLPTDYFTETGAQVYLCKNPQIFWNQNAFTGDLHLASIAQWSIQLQKASRINGVLATQMVGQGGLALSLVKMCRKGIGFKLRRASDLPELVEEVLYQAIFVVQNNKHKEFEATALALGLEFIGLGETQGKYFEVQNQARIDILEWSDLDQNELRRSIETLA